MDVIFSGIKTPDPIIKEVDKFPTNCSLCDESVITINNYSRCKLNGHCYIPCDVAKQRPENCPLKLKKENW